MAKTKTNQLRRVDIRGVKFDGNGTIVNIDVGDYQQTVHLTQTPCHYGNWRNWFICPHCSRGVAVLYLGGSGLGCRKCYRLVYAIENKTKSDRAIDSGFKIRDRLGWRGGFIGDTGSGKPKGMHWTTFKKLVARHDDYAAAVFGGIGVYIGRRFGL